MPQREVSVAHFIPAVAQEPWLRFAKAIGIDPVSHCRTHAPAGVPEKSIGVLTEAVGVTDQAAGVPAEEKGAAASAVDGSTLPVGGRNRCFGVFGGIEFLAPAMLRAESLVSGHPLPPRRGRGMG